MTNWMLYDFVKKSTESEIQHRLNWLSRKGEEWFTEFIKVSNKKADIDYQLQSAERQVKCWANQLKELTELAQKLGKLEEKEVKENKGI